MKSENIDCLFFYDTCEKLCEFHASRPEYPLKVKVAL